MKTLTIVVICLLSTECLAQSRLFTDGQRPPTTSSQEDPARKPSANDIVPVYDCLAETRAIRLKPKMTDTGLEMTGPGLVETQMEFPVPLEIDAVVATSGDDVRLYFGRGSVTLNWKDDRKVLRYVDPAAGNHNISVRGNGLIPINQPTRLRWVVDENATKFYVNGEERMTTDKDFRGFTGRIGIGAWTNSTIVVRSLRVTLKPASPQEKSDSTVAAPPAQIADVGMKPDELATRLKQRLDHSKDAEAALPAGVLNGRVEWAANEKCYRLDGVIQVGNSDRNHGGKWSKGDVVVGEGFVLSGGVLRASGGSITFKGTTANPVVLRRVRIECEYTASIVAENTIFDECTFKKTGSWHWNGGYSSKWQFTNCIANRSQFAGFTRMDYGVKLTNCAFLDCRFPARNWGYKNQEGPDETKVIRAEWSQIKDCDFFRCEMSPSAVWITENCNAIACVAGEKDAFTSDRDFSVELGVGEADGFLTQLSAKTSSTGTGRVRYVARPLPAGAVSKHLLWAWVLVGSETTPNGGVER